MENEHLHILIFRDSERAENLMEMLSSHDYKASAFSLVDIEPVYPKIGNELFDDVDWVAFTSGNAVRLFSELINSAKVIMPSGIRMAAVGSATAEYVKQYFEITPLTGKVANGVGLAEQLLEELKLKPGKVLWPSAEIVAGGFEETLGDSGFSVHRLVVYRSKPVENSKIIEKINSYGNFDLSVFFAPSSVKTALSCGLNLFSKPCLAIGNTTAKSLRNAGCNELLIADTPDDDSIVKVINNYYNKVDTI